MQIKTAAFFEKAAVFFNYPAGILKKAARFFTISLDVFFRSPERMNPIAETNRLKPCKLKLRNVSKLHLFTQKRVDLLNNSLILYQAFRRPF